MSLFNFVPTYCFEDVQDDVYQVIRVLCDCPEGDGIAGATEYLKSLSPRSAIAVAGILDKVARELNPPKSRKPRATEPKTKGVKK